MLSKNIEPVQVIVVLFKVKIELQHIHIITHVENYNNHLNSRSMARFTENLEKK